MPSEPWVRRKILIIGKTYPAYSQKYRETACTGGIFYDTYEMVRLYPIPFRYLSGEQAFKSWQIIEALVQRDMSDPRPESYRINFQSIKLLDEIPPKRAAERRGYLERSPNAVKSVEELRRRQKEEGLSLGIVKPASIFECDVEPKDEIEREIWEEKEREVTAQLLLFGEPSKPLDYIDARFKVGWRCNDDQCPKHHMFLHTWPIHQLYRKYRTDPDGKDKIVKAMWQCLDVTKLDVFLFLGSFRTIMVNFGLMDSYAAPRTDQMMLIPNFPLPDHEDFE
jgi:hypothetical protein